MRDVVHQIREGNRSVVGLMVESFLVAGSQPIPADLKQLRYGCSVTDPCVSFETTEQMLRAAREVLRPVLADRDRTPPAR
jgi:3-deoxy-7-phosphoheptulonate synthase